MSSLVRLTNKYYTITYQQHNSQGQKNKDKPHKNGYDRIIYDNNFAKEYVPFLTIVDKHHFIAFFSFLKCNERFI